jgi:hypothetical protein
VLQVSVGLVETPVTLVAGEESAGAEGTASSAANVDAVNPLRIWYASFEPTPPNVSPRLEKQLYDSFELLVPPFKKMEPVILCENKLGENRKMLSIALLQIFTLSLIRNDFP